MQAGLIKKETRNSAPYGFGDDEQFWLTAYGGVLIQIGKTNERIRIGVNNALIDYQTIGGRTRGPLFEPDEIDIEDDAL